MTQLANATTPDQMQLGVGRFMSASARMTRGLIEFQIASAKLTGDLWFGAIDNATNAANSLQGAKGLEASLKAAHARMDSALSEMRRINDRMLACSFECAEATLSEATAAAPIVGSAAESATVRQHQKQAAE